MTRAQADELLNELRRLDGEIERVEWEVEKARKNVADSEDKEKRAFWSESDRRAARAYLEDQEALRSRMIMRQDTITGQLRAYDGQMQAEDKARVEDNARTRLRASDRSEGDDEAEAYAFMDQVERGVEQGQREAEGKEERTGALDLMPETPEQVVDRSLRDPWTLDDEERYEALREQYLEYIGQLDAAGEDVRAKVEKLRRLDEAYWGVQEFYMARSVSEASTSAAAALILPAKDTGSDLSGSSGSSEFGTAKGGVTLDVTIGAATQASAPAQLALGSATLPRSVAPGPVPGVQGATAKLSVGQALQSGSAANTVNPMSLALVLGEGDLIQAETGAADTSGVSSRASSAADARPQPANATANTPLASKFAVSDAWLAQYRASLGLFDELHPEEQELRMKLASLSAVKSTESSDSSYSLSSTISSPELSTIKSVALSARASRAHFDPTIPAGAPTPIGRTPLQHMANLMTSELGVPRSHTGAQVPTPDSGEVGRQRRPETLAAHLLAGLSAMLNETVNASALDALVGAAVTSGAPPQTARRDVMHELNRASGRLSILLRHASVDPSRPQPTDEARVMALMQNAAQDLTDEEGGGVARKNAAAFGTIIELATAMANTAGTGAVDDPSAVMGRQVARRLAAGGTPAAPSKSDVAGESAFMSRNLMLDKRTRGKVIHFSPGEEEKRQSALAKSAAASRLAKSAAASRRAAAAGDAVLEGLFEAGAKPLAMGLRTAKKVHRKRE